MRPASAGEYAGAANSSLLQSFIDFSARLPYHNRPFKNNITNYAACRKLEDGPILGIGERFSSCGFNSRRRDYLYT